MCGLSILRTGLVIILLSGTMLASSGERVVVQPPTCSTLTAAPGPALASTTVPVGANPWGVAVSSTAMYVATSSELVVLDRSNRVVARVAAPEGSVLLGGALAPNGRMLFVAAGAGVVVFDTRSNQFVARLFDPNERGTVQVAVSPDSRYVAASDEQAGLVTVFNIADRSLVAQVHVAPFPTGLAFTPDGRALLVTSQRTSNPAAPGTDQQPGVLQVIDTKSWTVRDTVRAGCAPVRVAVSPTGRTWVTARGSNAVLKFDTKRLKSGAANALLAWIRVGAAPVGVTVADDGKRVVVANSNRFVPESPSTLSVIDARGPHGKPALTRSVATQVFPRDVTVSPDGNTVITSCFGSGTIDIVSLAS
jgi:DNA-binding beta-propeller fold protein YncE